MVASAPPAPSTPAGQGRSPSRIAFDRRGATQVSPEHAAFEHLAHRRDHALATPCIGRTRPHRGAAHRGRHRFSGQTRIGRYCRARYYHPGLSRFLSEDPLRLASPTGNLYAYVENAPLRFRDPLGLEKCSDTAAAVARDPLGYVGRFPDYVTLSAFGGPATAYGGVAISIDQKGNIFIAPGVSFDRGISLMGGWVARKDYSQTAVNSLLTGLGVTGSVGVKGFGVGITAAPTSGCHAVELGVTTGAGISAGWGLELGNLLDALRQ